MQEVDDPDFAPIKVVVPTTTGAATEQELGNLHGAVAKLLTKYVDRHVDDDDVSAALVGAAITLLKNNSITASPTENAALADLNKALNKKRRKGMDRKELDEAAEAYSAVAGNRLQ